MRAEAARTGRAGAARAYGAGALSGARRALRDPGDVLVRMLFYGIVLVVFAALWKAATRAHGGEIGGYDYRSLFWYLAGAEAAVVATKPRMIEEIGDEIGSGAVAIGLLRPVSYVGFRIAVELGQAVVRLAGVVCVGAALGLLLAGPPPSAAGVLAFAPVVLLAIACNLSAQHAFAAAAFWVADARASWFLYQKLIFLLGGMLLPFQLLPPVLRVVAWVLPFGTMAYAPGRVLSGHADWWLAAWQTAWLAVLLAAALGAFRAGERRLVVAGG